jgi:surface protein
MLADRVRMGRKKGEGKYIGEVYLAQDDDFVKVSNRWVYRGSELEIEIPHIIQGEEVTSYDYMFHGSLSYLATPVTRVDSNNKRVTSMNSMFRNSSATTLDLSSFDTSSVTNMNSMFYNSSATTLDLSSFDTSSVTNMNSMFRDSMATTLDLSSFDTSSVTNMIYMFTYSSATTLDLSSFDTSNVIYMNNMFQHSKATTLDLSSFDTSKVVNTTNMFQYSSATTGYARTQTDADKFNASSGKPAGLTFMVKP